MNKIIQDLQEKSKQYLTELSSISEKQDCSYKENEQLKDKIDKLSKEY